MQELRDGFYFGITGIGAHPRDGFKNEGAKGLFKGIGKGMGGLFLKPAAGMSYGKAIYLRSSLLQDICNQGYGVLRDIH